MQNPTLRKKFFEPQKITIGSEDREGILLKI